MSQLIPIESKAPRHERFVYIDALRGIAALAVVIYHLFHNTMVGGFVLKRIFPHCLEISAWGANGVQVFFILSGFVIAFSLRDNALTPRETGNFILRRQIRLDPPYWATILLCLGLTALERHIPQQAVPAFPTGTNLLVNFFYLADLLRMPRIVGVSWTLGIEIQFYLMFIFSLVFCKNLAASFGKATLPFTAGFMLLTGAASILANNWFFHEFVFTENWFYFAAGVLCCWVLTRKLAPIYFHLILGLFVFQLFLFIPPVFQLCRDHFGFIYVTPDQRVIPINHPHGLIMGTLAIISIYWIGMKGKLGSSLNYPVLQYFGKVSYSLYLVHSVLLSAFLRASYKFTGDNGALAIVSSILALAFSVAVAHLLHVCAEKPSMRLASKLRIKPPPAIPASQEEAGGLAPVAGNA